MASSVAIPSDTFKLGFIGAGKLAENIARGVVHSGILPASRISTAHRSSDRRDVFSSFGVKVFEQHQVVEHSDVIIFSVKPQMVTPNTPSAVGQAASVISLGGTATEEDGVLMGSLFGAIGKTWRANEKMFDAVTGLSGSGPAYIFLAIEALADGGVAAGLLRDLAAGLAAQTVLGAAVMVVNTGKHPGQLKDDVASPGGTTIAAIHELEKGEFRGTLMNAVVAAANRSKELSKN
ncbi:hypothetical protein MKX01_013765 [Papaver californicum]|nr:hypothetical protein MKX01_013765 [Papaver californicum]